jgi:transposase
MQIIGCDFHPSFQQIAWLEETGEVLERRLGHREEAEQFYRSLRGPVRVGMETCGHYPWFERLPQELGHELWLGDAVEIRAKVAPSPRERNGAVHGARGEVLPKSA